MRYRSTVFLVAAALGGRGVLRAQRPFKQYQAAEYEDFPLPPDWDKTLPAARSDGLTVGNAAFGKVAGSQTVGRQIQFRSKLFSKGAF